MFQLFDCFLVFFTIQLMKMCWQKKNLSRTTSCDAQHLCRLAYLNLHNFNKFSLRVNCCSFYDDSGIRQKQSIMFSDCPSTSYFLSSLCSVVWTVLVTVMSRERLEQFWWNIQRIFTIPYRWPYQILEVKGQGHSRLSRWRGYPLQRWGVEVQFLVWFS